VVQSVQANTDAQFNVLNTPHSITNSSQASIQQASVEAPYTLRLHRRRKKHRRFNILVEPAIWPDLNHALNRKDSIMSKPNAPLIPLYQSAILKWLREEGAKSPADIEDFIRLHFQGKWKARDRKINGTGIPQWRNDVHWARANLTRQGFTVNGAGLVQAVAKNAVKPRIKLTKPARGKEARPDSKALFDSLTADVLEALRNGNPPWRKPWGDLRRPKQHIDFAPLAIPTNAETGTPYLGVNTLTLWNATVKGMLTESRWGTANTWWRLGATVKPQAPFTQVRYFATVEVPNSDEEETRPIWHRLYNLAHVEGCDHLRQNHQLVRKIRTEGEIDTNRAWVFISKCGAKVTWGGNRACYDPTKDLIRMPHKQRFGSELDVITTLFHELAHWTGHKARLHRRGVGQNCDRDSREYAFEELVAELTACFLLAALEIPDRYEVSQHAGYIKGYISLLENDRKALWQAAGQAGNAARYLMKMFDQGK
jgi:antirestriction protein ArdC